MAWPFLLYFLAWFTNEGVFFTSRTPPPSLLAHLPSSLLVSASPGAVLISAAWSCFFPEQRVPGEPPKAVPRPLSWPRTCGDSRY